MLILEMREKNRNEERRKLKSLVILLSELGSTASDKTQERVPSMRWKFSFLLNYRQPGADTLRNISFSVAAPSSSVWFPLHGTRWLLDLQASHWLSHQQEGGIAEKNPHLFFPPPGIPPRCRTWYEHLEPLAQT